MNVQLMHKTSRTNNADVTPGWEYGYFNNLMIEKVLAN
jgi:hypothetical protein